MSVIGKNPPALPLSAAIEVGGLLFLSGQVALKGSRVQGDIVAQTDTVITAIDSLLKEAGLSLHHVLKATVWLADASDFSGFNSVYSRRFNAPYPARFCVVSQLLLEGARVEIEVIASRDHARS
jgi:2-iminobutanoate/2-iminopropanoate deaminase